MSSLGRKPWPPEEIWARFSLPIPSSVQPILSGQSRAWVFRVQTQSGDWALKATCQSSQQFRSRYSQHDLFKKANLFDSGDLPKPPVISLVYYLGFLWELLPWIVGEHLTWNQMTDGHWTAASESLERVHRSLASAGGQSVLPFARSRAFQIRSQVLRNAKADGSKGQPQWPLVFVVHPAWQNVLSCVKEAVDLAISDLNRREKEKVRLQPIHGDPHLGNWVWKGLKPNGLIDFLCPIDPAEADLARFGGSHDPDSLSNITRVCREYKKSDGVGPDRKLALELGFSGLISRLFRWRHWLGEEPNPGEKTIGRVSGIVSQIPAAFAWRKQWG